MRARHLSIARIPVALAILLLVATACASAAGPGSVAPSEPLASTEASPEPSPETTPAPTPEPEPSEPTLACLDPDLYALLVSDARQWTAEDMETLAAALEAYDLSDYDPHPIAAEIFESLKANLRRGVRADPGVQLSIQTGEIPVLPCD